MSINSNRFFQSDQDFSAITIWDFPKEMNESCSIDNALPARNEMEDMKSLGRSLIKDATKNPIRKHNKIESQAMHLTF